MGDGADSLKGKLLGWIQGKLGGQSSPPGASVKQSSPLCTSVKQPFPPGTSVNQLLQTTALSGEASFAEGSAPPGAVSSTVPLALEDSAADSKNRIALILAYFKDPASDPAFQDRAFVFQLLTKERSYHQKRIVELQARLRALPPKVPTDPVENERKELQERIEIAQKCQALLYSVMKRLTGINRKTGGTAFLQKPS
ncbi:MAG TPA: hypothetical protein DD435_00590 [Cyanobacteria bacterium UBA8530]|nr:hypothetical protein [Cyanobacteria bacterium UBA8530]